MDKVWWDVHIAEIEQIFQGERHTVNALPNKYNVRRHPPTQFNCYSNSGAGAITLAAKGGAKRIILLGYDSQKTGGKAHWHGDHPPTLGNAGHMDKWQKRFAEQAKDFADIEIINCSRQTALTCFPRANLEDVL